MLTNWILTEHNNIPHRPFLSFLFPPSFFQVALLQWLRNLTEINAYYMKSKETGQYTKVLPGYCKSNKLISVIGDKERVRQRCDCLFIFLFPLKRGRHKLSWYWHMLFSEKTRVMHAYQIWNPVSNFQNWLIEPTLTLPIKLRPAFLWFRSHSHTVPFITESLWSHQKQKEQEKKV